MRIIPFILGLVLLMTSCEYGYNYPYSVTNKTDSSIKVYTKTFQVDSTFIISKDSTKILFTKSHGIEGSKGPYFFDVNKDLQVFSITKNNVTSLRNYLKNDTWIFSKEGLNSAIVTDDEFKK